MFRVGDRALLWRSFSRMNGYSFFAIIERLTCCRWCIVSRIEEQRFFVVLQGDREETEVLYSDFVYIEPAKRSYRAKFWIGN